MCEKETKISFAKKTTCDDDPTEFVREFLQRKCVDENFINDILKYGLVDECIKALECQGLTCEDIETVQNALKQENSDICDCSSVSETVISHKYLEADYLKQHFNAILSSGLREIVIKKPFDPIEYLGHWLLHYRHCDEREKRKKEFEAELLEERLKWQEANKVECPVFKDLIEIRYCTGEEEEFRE